MGLTANPITGAALPLAATLDASVPDSAAFDASRARARASNVCAGAPRSCGSIVQDVLAAVSPVVGQILAAAGLSQTVDGGVVAAVAPVLADVVAAMGPLVDGAIEAVSVVGQIVDAIAPVVNETLNAVTPVLAALLAGLAELFDESVFPGFVELTGPPRTGVDGAIAPVEAVTATASSSTASIAPAASEAVSARGASSKGQRVSSHRHSRPPPPDPLDLSLLVSSGGSISGAGGLSAGSVALLVSLLALMPLAIFGRQSLPPAAWRPAAFASLPERPG